MKESQVISFPLETPNKIADRIIPGSDEVYGESSSMANQIRKLK
jgi:hypothetical protein